MYASMCVLCSIGDVDEARGALCFLLMYSVSGTIVILKINISQINVDELDLKT